METISNVTSAASRAIFGDKSAEGNNETEGKEPVSGKTGKGTVEEPYDQGNRDGGPTSPTSPTSPVPGESSGGATQPEATGGGSNPVAFSAGGSSNPVTTSAGGTTSEDRTPADDSQPTELSSAGESKAVESHSAGDSKPDESASTGDSKPDEPSLDVVSKSLPTPVSGGDSKPADASSAGNAKPDESSSAGDSKPDESSSAGHSKPDESSSAGHSKPDESSPDVVSKSLPTPVSGGDSTSADPASDKPSVPDDRPTSRDGSGPSGPSAGHPTEAGIADPSSGQKPEQKQQGGDRPEEDPSEEAGQETGTEAAIKASKEEAETAQRALDTRDPNDHSGEPLKVHDGTETKAGASTDDGTKGEGEHKGTGMGTEYVKTSGLAADDGDFDAAKPGAGKEADRLLEQKGVKPTAAAESSKAKDSSPAPSSQKADSESGTPSKRSMGTRIKEKLHISKK